MQQILGIGIGVPAVLSLLTPWLGTTVTAMLVIRVLQGLFGGVTFPCIHDVSLYLLFTELTQQQNYSKIFRYGFTGRRSQRDHE